MIKKIVRLFKKCKHENISSAACPFTMRTYEECTDCGAKRSYRTEA